MSVPQEMSNCDKLELKYTQNLLPILGILKWSLQQEGSNKF